MQTLVNTYEMGTESSMLRCKTLARTGGSAAFACKQLVVIAITKKQEMKPKIENELYHSRFTLRTGVTDPSLRVKISESDND